MSREPSAVRAARRKDHPGRHGYRIPATISHDLADEPSLHVDLPNELIDVRNVRLEFDDQERPLRRMPRDDVDDPALSIDRERDLGCEHPCRELAGEPARDELVQRGVLGVEQAIEVAGAPPGHEVDSNIQRRCDPPDRIERECPGMASLDPGNGRGRDTGPCRKVSLAPASLQPNGADRRPNSLVIHDPESAVASSTATYLAGVAPGDTYVTPTRKKRRFDALTHLPMQLLPIRAPRTAITVLGCNS